MPISRSVNALLIVLISVFVAACGGGGDEEPSPPTITFQGLTTLGWAKVRLSFSATDGFAQAVSVGDDVVWHSGMVSGVQPTAPRAKVQRSADGSLYAEAVLYYTTDRGLFGVAPAGYSLTMLNGQPANHMVPGRWQLPAAMKPVALPDGRVWLDVSF